MAYRLIIIRARLKLISSQGFSTTAAKDNTDVLLKEKRKKPQGTASDTHTAKRVSNLLRQVAGPRGRVDDFVIEDGKVEGEAEPYRMGRLHLRLGDVERLLVRLLRVLHDCCNANDTEYSKTVGS